MAKKKVKFVVVRFIIFLVFVWMLIHFISNMKNKYFFLMEKKIENTEEFVKNFEIRTSNFYKDPNYKNEKKVFKEKKEEKEIIEKKTDGKKYFVTIATYSKKENAERKKKILEAFSLKIDEKKSKGNVYYRLISHNFNDIKEADIFIQELKNVSKDEKPLIRVRY